jgi:hypothetical protein
MARSCRRRARSLCECVCVCTCTSRDHVSPNNSPAPSLHTFARARVSRQPSFSRTKRTHLPYCSTRLNRDAHQTAQLTVFRGSLASPSEFRNVSNTSLRHASASGTPYDHYPFTLVGPVVALPRELELANGMQREVSSNVGEVLSCQLVSRLWRARY